MLACLRQCGEILRRKDSERTKADELLILRLFETFRNLIDHPHSNVFRCGLTHGSDGAALRDGGGTSALLLLLALSERLRVVGSAVATVDRSETFSEAVRVVDELALKLVARAETDVELDELCSCLFEVHEANAWRPVGLSSRICCLELALRGEHRALLSSHWVQEALRRAWYRSSRYHFWLALSLYIILVLATTFVGWMSSGIYPFKESIMSRALRNGEPDGVDACEDVTQWLGWLAETFVQAVAPPTATGSDFTSWYALDALRLRTFSRLVPVCGGGFNNLTMAVCASLIAASPSNMTAAWRIQDIPLHDAQEARRIVREIASSMRGEQIEHVEVYANIFSPAYSVISRTTVSLDIGLFGDVRHQYSINALPLSARGELLMLQVGVAIGMTVVCGVELHDMQTNGRRHLLHFWNVVDLLHNTFFVVWLLLLIIQMLFIVKPSDFMLQTHTNLDMMFSVRVAYMRVLSLFVLMAWVRLMKYLRMAKRVGILVEVILVIVRQLAAFFTLFVMLWVGVASAYVPMFGDHLRSFASIDLAFIEALKMLSLTATDFGDAFIEQGVLGIFFSIVINVFIATVLVNLLVAILNQSYSETVSEANLQYLMLQAELTLSFYLRVGQGNRRVIKLEGAAILKNSSSRSSGSADESWGRLRGSNVQEIPRAAEAKVGTPSDQLAKYLKDDIHGLDRLHSDFLWRMEHPAFGSALAKVRYIRQVWVQCGQDSQDSHSWLSNHGQAMLTPNLESDRIVLTIRFPDVDRAHLLALLLGPCGQSVAMATEVLSGKRTLSMYEEMQLRSARERLDERMARPHLMFMKRPMLSRRQRFQDSIAQLVETKKFLDKWQQESFKRKQLPEEGDEAAVSAVAEAMTAGAGTCGPTSRRMGGCTAGRSAPRACIGGALSSTEPSSCPPPFEKLPEAQPEVQSLPTSSIQERAQQTWRNLVAQPIMQAISAENTAGSDMSPSRQRANLQA